MARRKKNPHMAIAYVRMSTEDQCLSPEAQRAQIARFAAANQLEIAAIFEDLGLSGADAMEDRPGLLSAIDTLQERGAGVLLVAKRDRLARDTVIAGMVQRLVERSGAKILSADGATNGEGAEGTLMRGIVDVFAQYELMLIRFRTKAALAVKKTRGECIGQAPYGYRRVDLGEDKASILEVIPEEQEVIGRIHELHNQGSSLKNICTQLATTGVPPRGKTWHTTTVHRILTRAVL